MARSHFAESSAVGEAGDWKAGPEWVMGKVRDGTGMLENMFLS